MFALLLAVHSYFESTLSRMRSLCCVKLHAVAACFRVFVPVTVHDLTFTGKVKQFFYIKVSFYQPHNSKTHEDIFYQKRLLHDTCLLFM